MSTQNEQKEEQQFGIIVTEQIFKKIQGISILKGENIEDVMSEIIGLGIFITEQSFRKNEIFIRDRDGDVRKLVPPGKAN